MQQRPLLIKINPLDNVAIVVNDGGLAPSTYVEAQDFTLVEAVPQGHKVLLTELKENDPIVRYGEIIGYANKDLSAGSWVNEAVTRMPEAPTLDSLDMATRPAPSLELLTGIS